MNPVTSLVCFGLRQVLGDVANVLAAVEQHLIDHSSALAGALATANNKAWRALAVSLAGDGFCDKVKVWLTASGDEKGFRDQVHRLLASQAIPCEGSPAAFRGLCLAELNQALKAKALSAEGLPRDEIVRGTADFRRYTDPQALIKGADEAVAQVAKALEARYANLARLLAQPTPGGPPLLAAAFSYFFRREVERDDELANGLMFDGLRQLSAAQAKSFGELGKALDGLGERFDEAFGAMAEELEVTRKAAVEAREAARKAEEEARKARAASEETQAKVLILQDEQQRLGGLQLDRIEDIRSLMVDVQRQLAKAGMPQGEVKPQYSFSIRGEDEKRAVNALLDRFRQLPEEQRKQLPALLNGLGKLQVGIGDSTGATETFKKVAAEVSDAAAKAEAYHNAYLAALEKEHWGEALDAITQAVALDRARFSPFPLGRYRPVQILGAGGFGTVYLCQDANFKGREVAIKTLHDTDLVRGLDEVFGEAHALIELNHPAIIGVIDCTFCDTENRRRPYIVMQYFRGGSLEKQLRERGPLAPGQLLAVARQVASAMKAAHDRGILHRDLKPDNVLVREAGGQLEAKVIDFGLSLRSDAVDAGKASSTAKSRLTESIAGTAKYAPPEQMGELPGVQPGRYSDVYSFGKMCYAMLFGTPQPDDDEKATLPAPWRELLSRCTAQKIEKRPKDFGEVLDALQRPEPPETVRAPCPNCPAVLKIPANLLTPGKKVRCPKCSTVFIPIPLLGGGSAANASLVSSLNPAVGGQVITFTATLTPVSPATGTPTGTVTFKDGAVVLGSGTLNSGTATLTTSALSAGSHGITASYAGDALFLACTSPPLSQNVTTGKGTGVIASIAEFLLAASEREPVSKETIVQRLSKRFPDRDLEKMTATLNAQVPTRIQKERGLVVRDDGKGGYWATKRPPKPPYRERKAKLLAVLTDKPQTVPALRRASGVNVGCSSCLRKMAQEGLVVRTEDGSYKVAHGDGEPSRWKRFLDGILSRPNAKRTSGVRGLRFGYPVGQDEGRVELYIDRGKAAENKELFDRFHRHKEEIDKAFGGELSWQRLDQKKACRIAYITAGGYKSDESKWPAIQDAMIDAMIRLDKALTPHLRTLKAGLPGEVPPTHQEDQHDPAVPLDPSEPSALRKRFWKGLLRLPKARQPGRRTGEGWLHRSWIATGAGVRGLFLSYVIGQDEAKVELYIGRGEDAESKELFDRIRQHKEEIEKTFGSALSWQRLDDKRGCRIAYTLTLGGFKSDESKWPEIQDAMIDAMIRLEKALAPHLAKLKAELASGGE